MKNTINVGSSVMNMNIIHTGSFCLNPKRPPCGRNLVDFSIREDFKINVNHAGWRYGHVDEIQDALNREAEQKKKPAPTLLLRLV